MVSISPEERKEIAIYDHVWSIVDIFNEDQMSEVRSYMESWMRSSGIRGMFLLIQRVGV